MKIENNTDKFLALKKLSDLKAEYHKQHLVELLTFNKNQKKSLNYFGKATGAMQSIINLVKILRT
jgi:hypothetical protein